MDNILKSIPKNLKSNSNLVEIRNKLTFGDINIKNLKLNSNFNHIIFDNLHASKINISPIKISGVLNVFQFNNFNKSFSFKVNNFHNVKENYTKTNEFFSIVKNLEKQMENYNTGLHIKCYQNLTLENFDIDSNQEGEQVIYLKNCTINGNLTINSSGRSLIILDNTSVSKVINFNLSTKFKPPKEVKVNPVVAESESEEIPVNSSVEAIVLKRNKNDKSKNKTINKILIGTIIAVIAVGVYFIKKK